MGEGGVVGGVILDESVLLMPKDNNKNKKRELTISETAHFLLRRLRHSNLRRAISYAPAHPHHQEGESEGLLKATASFYSCDCFVIGNTSVPSSSQVEAEAGTFHLIPCMPWGQILDATILYVASKTKHHLFQPLTNLGCLIVLVDAEASDACDINSNILCIPKLEELLLTICRLNAKATCNNVLTVGYTMKPSREEDFAKRGAFPISPNLNGLMFFPLMFELPLAPQLQQVDIVLHKATDEIISIELNDTSESLPRVTYTTGMQELQRYLELNSDCLVIDSLDKIYPVLDRLKIQQILGGLEDLNTGSRCAIRGPHFLKVNDFNEHDLVQKLSQARLSLPCIVKPQVACGVADAHSMAIIFRVEDFKDLTVPVPALIQEYVNHSSTLFKIYCLGGRVFYAVKKSTPNGVILMKLTEKDGLKPLIFDSLKSLPTSTEQAAGGDSLEANFDLDLVTDAANWLSRKLDLTIFGFDVVIQEGMGDHVIVDVNYLPSFKELPDDVAVPAFWDAIREKYEAKKMRK